MDTIIDRAQALLQERIGSIRELEKCAQEASMARDALRSAESKLADAWTAATKIGWTAEELRKLGIEQPASRRGGRRKHTTRRNTGSKTQETPPPATKQAATSPAHDRAEQQIIQVGTA